MKKKSKKAWIISIAVLLCGIFAVGGIIMFNIDKSANFKKITDFETLNLRLSGMRITEEYEIISKGESAEISYYQINYANGGENRQLIKAVSCKTQEVIDIFNECGMGKWNGFHGEHPKGVLDGTMFKLTASVNGGKEISADGSQNFPKNFHTLEQWLYNKIK